MVARVQGHRWKQGKASRPVEKAHGSKVTAQVDKTEFGEGERLADGSVVALKRGNARRAKGPYRRHSEGEARHAG